MDMYQFNKIVGLNSSNKEIPVNYNIIGKKIFLKQDEGKYIIEYYAYPSDIDLDTEDDFELEIDKDAQNVLPYMVANDILKVDPSADYTAFYREYQNRMQILLNSKMTQPSATVSEGVL